MNEKERLTWATRLALAKALLKQDSVHCDDVDVDLPPAHRNILGATFARFVQKGWMVEARDIPRRPSKRKCTNGRKSSSYRITEQGRRVFVAGPGTGSSPLVSDRATPLARKPATTGDPASPPARGALAPLHGVSSYAPVSGPELDAREREWDRWIAQDPDLIDDGFEQMELAA